MSVPDTISGTFVPSFTPDDPSKCFYHEFMYRHVGDYVCIHVEQVEPIHVATYDIFLRAGEFPNALVYDVSSNVVLERDWMTCLPPEKFHKIAVMYLSLCPKAIPGKYKQDLVDFWIL